MCPQVPKLVKTFKHALKYEKGNDTQDIRGLPLAGVCRDCPTIPGMR